MNKGHHVFFYAMGILLVFVVLPISGLADSWKFGIIADTQWRPVTQENQGTAIHIIDAVNTKMIRHGVEVVIHVGDLVDTSSLEAFEFCAARFKTLEEAGILFRPVRGNHDAQKPEHSIDFRKAFPNLPKNSPDLPGVSGLTYSFVHKGVKFIHVDPFSMDDGKSNSVRYRIADYLPWIEKELEADDYRHAFIVRHYGLINQKDGRTTPEYTRASEKAENRFFEIMQNTGVRYLFAGHCHLYSRSTITSPNGMFRVGQIICGCNAHKFYEPGPPFTDRQYTHALETGRVSCIIVTVDGDTVAFEYFSTEPFGNAPANPAWELRERFGYSLNGTRFSEQYVNLNPLLRTVPPARSVRQPEPAAHVIP